MATDKLVEIDHVKDFISREVAISEIMSEPTDAHYPSWYAEKLKQIPAADVVQEENILKFYYVRSIDEYWIGRRLDNFYYAIYESENQQWVWAYSRYLPWGEHVVSPTSLWKEHTYPSEPEEISFTDWLKRFSQKYVAADVRPVVRARWYWDNYKYDWCCSNCLHPADHNIEKEDAYKEPHFKFCPHCGADLREPNLDATKGERRDESSG